MPVIGRLKIPLDRKQISEYKDARKGEKLEECECMAISGVTVQADERRPGWADTLTTNVCFPTAHRRFFFLFDTVVL